MKKYYRHNLIVQITIPVVNESVYLSTRAAKKMVREMDPVVFKDGVGWGRFNVFVITEESPVNEDGDPFSEEEEVAEPAFDVKGEEEEDPVAIALEVLKEAHKRALVKAKRQWECAREEAQ